MKTIAERLQSASETIAGLCQMLNKSPSQVQLLAVSKTKPVEDILEAYQAGQRLFGENYVQEGAEKIQALQAYPDIEWHFIGPLQSNKTRLVAAHFDWVQSVDRLKIAQRLSEQRPAGSAPLQVLLQINISHEQSKSGVGDEAALFALAEQVNSLPNLTLRGLMAIPAADLDEQAQERVFSQLHSLFSALQARYPQVDTLSMGMSADMPAAIKAGSTMVRLGTAIFGARAKRAET
ncbi:YggS family pyridoxal phosphate-dependent enzyme [Bowmanella yangjiangensis]|uniref:Pyridoxal phosphate homeostasis protein n=1 Tax=Bowmanella yangjiangensis TaxID=2811230 RepID=A0ABS3CMJ1_9ALTE|nr:YggS family pyridoxal phosphate-dependent enzyme [Bowmanella yangjiangensis]MBN7818313.1 YggS family pyridoxal phosphate-dependent enzyme [Bowmanella yangjiangensis]